MTGKDGFAFWEEVNIFLGKMFMFVYIYKCLFSNILSTYSSTYSVVSLSIISYKLTKIFSAYLYMINQHALFDLCGFCGVVLVLGDSDRGKYSFLAAFIYISDPFPYTLTH